jgi:heme oxygenase
MDHDAVEGSVPLMGEDLTLDRYIACLQQLHGIVYAWEVVAQEGAAALTAAPWLQALLAGRRREAMLRRDLSFLASPVASPISPNAFPLLPPLNDVPSLLGAMYVMEGSTLGGQLIARHVERVLPLSGGDGSEFFRGHRDQTATMWKEFCEVLRIRIPESETPIVIDVAKKMFAAFGGWMDQNPKLTRVAVNNNTGSHAASAESKFIPT